MSTEPHTLGGKPLAPSECSDWHSWVCCTLPTKLQCTLFGSVIFFLLLACHQGDELGFVIGDPAASAPLWGIKPETAAKRRKVAATKAARRRIEVKRLAQAELQPDFDDARRERLMPSKREKRKTQFGSRVGWSQQEDEVMLRGYLWCVPTSVALAAANSIAFLLALHQLQALIFASDDLWFPDPSPAPTSVFSAATAVKTTPSSLDSQTHLRRSRSPISESSRPAEHDIYPARCRYTAHYGETLTSPWDYVRYEARARVRQLKRRWLKLTADPTCAPLAAKLQELAQALHRRLLALVGEPGPTQRKRRGVRKGACACCWPTSSLLSCRCGVASGECLACLLLHSSFTSHSRPDSGSTEGHGKPLYPAGYKKRPAKVLLPPPSTKRLRTQFGRAESEPGDAAMAPQASQRQTEGSMSSSHADPLADSDTREDAAAGAEVAEPHSNVTDGVAAEATPEVAQAQAPAETDGAADEEVDVEFRPLHGEFVHPNIKL